MGDNGQSIVLGGITPEGIDGFNMLSKMCLEASMELKLINPKINVRVNKQTKLEIFELGTNLTKEGLGFPQYSNDDVVIPGLIKLGYEPEDARNYVVAACWEFIIPGLGMEIPNISSLSFPKVIDVCLNEKLENCQNFKDFVACCREEIFNQCNTLLQRFNNLYILPAPFMSVLMDNCMQQARDISLGGKYNNFGLHGSGIATAVDSLAAINQLVFKEKFVTAKEMIKAVKADFVGYDELLNRVRYNTPKMGNDDDEVDYLAVELLNAFSDALNDWRNERGGRCRAGTGSAMYYLRHISEIGASPDGRRKGEPFGANYSPSLFSRVKGPISIIKSFTKPNLCKVINGGPLTMEFHDSLFRDKDSIQKVAMLVKTFIELNGHQFQLNAVNREILLDAQIHPELYMNLIVRVWGWSAYFIELDKVYQDHIISRQMHVV